MVLERTSTCTEKNITEAFEKHIEYTMVDSQSLRYNAAKIISVR